MTDETVFNDETSTEENPSNTRSPETPSILSEYVGEGKRFKDEVTLLRSKFEGDAHIKKIEAENAKLREREAELQKLVDAALEEPTKPERSTERGLTKEEIAAQVRNEIKAEKQASRVDANLTEVDRTVKQAHGGDVAKAQAFMRTKAEELGTTVKDLMRIAAENPKLFYRSVGIEANKQTEATNLPTSSRNTDAPNPAPKQGTWAYYEALRISNPEEYWNPRTQIKLIADAERDPVAFGLPR